MDGGVRTLTGQDATSATFHDRVALKNVKGVAFDLSVDRKVEVLGKEDVEKLLGAPLPEGRVCRLRPPTRSPNEATGW